MEEKIKKAILKIHNAGGCDGKDDYSKGWDDAISEALNLLCKETGIEIQDMLLESK